MPDPSVPTDAQYSLDHYDFEFSKDRIAQHPLDDRSAARLMVVDRATQSITHSYVRNLGEFLSPGDMMVLNDTQVVAAQLAGVREKTGGRWQGLFLESDDSGLWKILCKTRGKLEPGESVQLIDREGRDSYRLTMLSKLDGGQWAVKPESDDPWTTILKTAGRIPLPHYIRGGKMVDTDLTDYQTVFAKKPGAVAAPTAGLHFTKDHLLQLKDNGVEIGNVTLHVGMGTFRPVQTDDIKSHQMHSEWGEVSSKTVQTIGKVKADGNRVVAVGTTCMRALESACRMPSVEDQKETSSQLDPAGIRPWSGSTDIFITPGFQFGCVDALMTNFHLPKTTLLILVHTFGGDQLVRRAYQEAVEREYRFFSYGDTMLIL